MNKIITTEEFKSLIAKNSGLQPALVSLYIDELINIIIETLTTGEEVEIEGLGIFRLIEFAGSSKKRMLFITSDEFRSGVNSPFSQFDPIILEEGSASEMEDKPDTKNSDSESQNDQNNKTPEKQEFVKPEEVSKLNDEEIVNSLGKNLISDDNNLIMDKDESKEINKSLNEELSDNNKPEVSETESEATVEVSDGNGDLDKEIKDEIVNPIEMNEAPGKTSDGQGETPSKDKSKIYVYLLLILLAIVIIGTMIYLFVRVNRFDKETVPYQEVKEEILKNSPKKQPASNVVKPQETKAVQSNAKAIAAEPKKDVKKVVEPAVVTNNANEKPGRKTPIDVNIKRNKISSNPVLTTERLNEGSRLTLLSLKHYGDKCFWVYIYDLNKEKYPNPDVIPVDAEIKIPVPELYDIDRNNEKSISRANDFAIKIQRENEK